MDAAWVFDTPVTSPIKSPVKSRPYEFPNIDESLLFVSPLSELSGELEQEVEHRSAQVMTWQLFSTTLVVLVVAATASLATNRVSEILFVALAAYLLIRGVMSSFISNILAPGPGPFGYLARTFVEWMNFPSIDSAARLLAPKDGDVVLDIGARDGRGLRSILHLCNPSKLYATELSPSTLAVLRADPAFATVESHETDPRSLSFLPKHSVDKILAVNVIYFWEPLADYLAEVRRVLKPGGTFLVMAKFHLTIGTRDPWSCTRSNPFIHTDAVEVQGALKAAGFSVQTQHVKLGCWLFDYQALVCKSIS